ncbi:transcription antitermination factor NusB [Curtobacterium sp. MCBD17_034]|uniref:transcription antitermination factor NusB n=1 Tax=unclassified Curtobacterium TaxID=257496 RepID=UPI000DA933B2|nr:MULTISPECIES: transcription antitermination factor NusB [unclassified Curtobacterium]PZF59139.1 transcription antitermination factor NusB [Curtobacterium sp. MCBD17_034]PZM34319.1 transcription antitermination factor NusB [Curtobacterium sp. MCBD17_031]WIE53295.1 transcription antitermination factor NusB [Curtobacterium sp. MCBD17_003]
MSARSKARKRALDMLYVAEVRGLPIAEVLATETVRHLDQPERASSWDYARQIVTGVDDDRAEIDRIIVDHAQGWTIARMPVLDRCILRMGVWEIRWNDEVPDAVAIAEAVELAQSLSTDDSAGFVNGVLGAVAGRARARTATTADDAGAVAEPDPGR